MKLKPFKTLQSPFGEDIYVKDLHHILLITVVITMGKERKRRDDASENTNTIRETLFKSYIRRGCVPLFTTPPPPLFLFLFLRWITHNIGKITRQNRSTEKVRVLSLYIHN